MVQLLFCYTICDLFVYGLTIGGGILILNGFSFLYDLYHFY